MKAGQFLDIIAYRAIAELRAEASRTYAGYLWWILQPLMMFGTYYLAFKWVLPERNDFALFIFTGIVTWHWFALTVLRCSDSLIASKALMQQVNLHKLVFPMSIIAVNSAKFLVTLGLLGVVLWIGGFAPSLSWLSLVPIFIVQLLVITGVGSAAATISPFVPDFHLILGTVLQLMFFVSGIIYELDTLPPDIAAILNLNPMAIIIDESRNVLMHQAWPQWHRLLLPLAQSIVLIALSAAVIHKFDKLYPKLG